MKRFACLFLFCVSQFAFAGGPLNVAGVSGFQPGLAGTPITWANGQIGYYTDQGNLSPLLPNAAADQFVAEAFSRWTSIPTAAVTATRLGALDEDVNGTNVTMIQGMLSLPNDLGVNSGKSLAIVYDSDGRIFDTLLGTGAGAPEMCATNSVHSLVNKITDDAHIAHALVFINGNCGKTTAQVAVLRYRLVRALGQVLGLDYSQLNDNVVNGSPSPSLDDYAGFPLMHPLGVLCTEAGCQSDADQPRMDDRAALSRLYPVTAGNQSSGKSVFRDSTARISGTVRFPAWKGTLGQGMQGVNVVARLVDPVTSRVSRRYAASSVSGFLFRGNAGNPITGFYDVLGQRRDSYGTDDPSREGFYDLSGLEVPDGFANATYEISVEPVNPMYVDSTAVGPYKQGQVVPSGSFSTMRATVSKGGEVAQDISMQKAASEAADPFEPQSFHFPASMPASGDWISSLSGYGDLDYMYFVARANRSFTFDVTALDANGAPTTTKAQPVVGVWTANDREDSPRLFENYFNSAETGTTRLQGAVLSDGEYNLGVADARGDGRPDFRYRARLLYADDIAPSRASVKGGTSVVISGTGFADNMQVLVGSQPVIATTVGSDRIVFTSPSLPDGTYSIVVRDLTNGALSQIDNALRVGSADARVILLGGSNPQIPIGTQAPNPFRVQVVDSNSGEPVSGGTVIFTVPQTASIVECVQNPCTLQTDQNGAINVYLTVKAAGSSVITATLPNGASTAITVNGIAAPLEITIANPSVNISTGVSATVPVTATVVADGAPVSDRTVNFLLNSGTATITPASSVTNSDGNATSAVTVTAIAGDVNISACVAPGNAPCRTLMIHAVQPSNLVIQRVSGDQQTIPVGETFAPVTIRVLDAGGIAVSGVPVTFMVDVYRVAADTVRVQRGEVIVTTRDEPVVLATSLNTAVSDAFGLASLTLSVNENQPVRVVVQAIAGQSELSLVLQSMWAQNLVTPIPGSAPSGAISSRVSQPIRSRFYTKADRSAASGSNVLRRGSKASSKAPSSAEDK